MACFQLTMQTTGSDGPSENESADNIGIGPAQPVATSSSRTVTARGRSKKTRKRKYYKRIMEKIYYCKICSKSFNRIGILKLHMRTHTGEKPHVCGLCFKGFTHKSYLKAHMEIHNKKFACPDCKNYFATRRELRVHSSVHTGERPYLCNVCGKNFRVLAVLKGHAVTHMPQRPFECDVCEKTYKTKKALKHHMSGPHFVEYILDKDTKGITSKLAYKKLSLE